MGFGIWLSNTTEKFQNSLKNLKTHSAAPREFSNFSVSFEIFPWCLSQIPNPTSPQKDVCTKMCGNLYFVKEVHIEGGKHFDHNIDVALCTDIYKNI